MLSFANELSGVAENSLLGEKGGFQTCFIWLQEVKLIMFPLDHMKQNNLVLCQVNISKLLGWLKTYKKCTDKRLSVPEAFHPNLWMHIT